MKKLARLLFPLSLLVFVSGCEDDLPQVVVPETPVVFAILDKTDSLHYVKITHSFGGANNAIEVAQIPDSSYYSDIDVKIEEWLPLTSNYSNMQKTRTWTLRDTTLNGKAPGTFYGPAQKVYYFKTDAYNSSNIPQDFDPDLSVALKQPAVYKLVATVNGGEYTINSETRLVEEFSVLSPAPNVALGFCGSTTDPTAYNAGVFTAGFSGIVSASVEVFFNEFYNGTPVEKSFSVNLGSKEGTSGGASFELYGKTFYEKIKATATNDPAITKRQLSKIKVSFTGASKTLSDYIHLGEPTSSFEYGKDFFTNVTASDGRRVIGVFTSSYMKTYTKVDWDPDHPILRAITLASVKALCNGPITGSLLFCSDNPQDAGESFSCQ